MPARGRRLGWKCQPIDDKTAILCTGGVAPYRHPWRDARGIFEWSRDMIVASCMNIYRSRRVQARAALYIDDGPWVAVRLAVSWALRSFDVSMAFWRVLMSLLAAFAAFMFSSHPSDSFCLVVAAVRGTFAALSNQLCSCCCDAGCCSTSTLGNSSCLSCLESTCLRSWACASRMAFLRSSSANKRGQSISPSSVDDTAATSSGWSTPALPHCLIKAEQSR